MYAAHISERVPEPPPTTITPSADSALRKSLDNPRPLGITMSQYSFANDGLSCGSIPTVNPPASCAPRDAAFITPPRPPVIKTEPDFATSAPTSYASLSSSGVQPFSLLPITRICLRFVNQ